LKKWLVHQREGDAVRLLLGLVIIFLSIPAPAQVGQQRHGTVNIVLANPQGMVVVTDSLLSSPNHAPSTGQKLFRIDDHTICAVAGWYSSGGPTVDGVHYPAFTAVSNIIRWFTAVNPSLASLPIENKIQVLARVVKFGLETMAAVDEASGDPLSDQPSQITLSGFDSGQLKIAQVVLVPRLALRGALYEEQNVTVRVVKDVLIYAVAGIPAVAAPILEHPNIPRPSDVILQMYADEMAKDGGKSLTLEEMEQVAKLLEFKTARRFPNVVGGLPEVAIIKDGKAEVIDSPFEPDLEPAPSPAIILRITRPQFRARFGISVEGPGADFVEDGLLSGCEYQQLDHIFFFRTTFDHCVLYYNGTPNFIFDRSNTVIDSKLVLTFDTLFDSPGVREIRANFPDLPIEDQTGKLLTSPK
jgi:hypothetical protein